MRPRRPLAFRERRRRAERELPPGGDPKRARYAADGLETLRALVFVRVRTRTLHEASGATHASSAEARKAGRGALHHEKARANDRITRRAERSGGGCAR